MRSLRYIGTVLMLLIAFLQGANAREESDTDYKEQQVDVNEIVFGHIGDSYEWHITDIGDTPIAIPLPVIVKSKYRMARFSFLLSLRKETESMKDCTLLKTVNIKVR